MFEYASFATRNPSHVIQHARDQWATRKAMLEYKRENPACEITGRTWFVHIHHVIPVSVSPDLAGDKANFMSLHKGQHLYTAHAGSWKDFVPNLRAVVMLIHITRTVPP